MAEKLSVKNATKGIRDEQLRIAYPIGFSFGAVTSRRDSEKRAPIFRAPNRKNNEYLFAASKQF